MLFNSLFGRKNSVSSTSSSFKSAKLNKKNHQPRHVAFEPLESRDLLTVTTGSIDGAMYDEIRAAYPDFNLPELQADLNVMTITPDDSALSLADLQAAIYDAGTTTLPDLILVMTSADANSVTYASSEDELAIDIDTSQFGSLTILGWGEDYFTLDANDQSRVVIVSEASTVNLGGLTMTGGNSTASMINSDIYGAYAGGIGSLGTLTISNCAITDNTALYYGGGIASSGTLTIIDSLIFNNTTTGTDDYYSGGGGIASSGTVTIINSEISNNEAASGAGIINSEGTLLIYGSVISHNTATSEYSSGGGIVNSQGDLVIFNSVISDNSALNGGGIYNWGMVTVTKSEIINNTADGIGGGICNDYGTCTVISSTVSGNRSEECGGGIYCWWEDSDLTVMNSEISGNESAQGGGIFNKGVTYVYNSTISANTAESGGGVYNSDSLTVTNSTIAGNTLTESLDGVGNGIYSSGSAAINNSIIVDDIVNEDGYGTITGAYNLSVYSGWSSDSYNIAYDSTQPLFVDAANGDYHLAAGSQAIDRGNNDLAVDADGYALTNDQSGRLRINNGVVDIGAFEYKESISDYEAIRSAYADLELPVSEYDVNIIVVDLTAGDGLAELHAAIATAGMTLQDDLIVVYTSDDANTLTYSDNEDALVIETDADDFGSVTLVSWGDSKLTLDANFDGNVICDYGNETVVNLGGLRIVNGYTGVFNEYGTVSVAQCEFSGNYTGIYNGYGVLSISDCSIKNSENNGIFNNSGTLTVTNSELSSNTGDRGGAICNSDGIATVTDCQISDNNAQGEGGAIYNGFGTLTVLNSEISGNKSGSGGAINCAGGTLTVMNSEISENIANYDGGGIAGYFEKVIFTNSVIAGNTAIYGGGGGIYAGSGSITVTNCTIEGNSAQYGGTGIYNNASATINNSIIVDDLYMDIDAAVSGSNNLSTITGWSSGSDNIDYNPTQPLFLDADNGDYHLTDGAVAIDAGNNDLAVDAKGVALAYDLDGAPRISNGTVDIGAYEFVLDSSTLARPVLSTPIFEDDGSVTVSWSNVNNASGYLFEYKLTSDADWTSIDLTEQSFSLDLPDGQAYKVRVKALGGADYNDSAYSSEKLIFNYDDIREKYSTFDLPESKDNINIIVVDLTAGDNLAKLKKSVQKAVETAQEDLIVVLTSNDANTLKYTNSTDTLMFEDYSGTSYPITVISLGDSNLTIDANHLCRAIAVGSGIDVNLGGLTITNGYMTTDDGSAIINYGTLSISNSAITGNYTPNCGGILNSESGTLIVTNSLISDNVSETSGGGIYNYGYALLTNSVITDNSSNYGGGICNVSNLSVINSTIAANVAANEGSGIYNSGISLYADNSIIVDEIVGDIAGNNNLSTFTGWTYGDDNLSYDPSKPLFVNAANGDYHLAAGSQAIDNGNNDAAIDLYGAALEVDMDGNARIVNGTVDIGAYEYQGGDEPIVYSPVVTTLNDSFDLNDDKWSLREAIYYAPENVTITFAENLEGIIVLDQNLGQLEIYKVLVIDGDGRITIDAKENSRVIMVSAGTPETPVVLNGLTIQNGYLDDGDGGAGVYNAGVLTVSNCTIEGNTASGEDGFGGGIFNGYECTLTVANSNISGNEAAFSGGGICNEGVLTVTDCTIEGNSAGGYGAGIEHAVGTAVISNSVIKGNAVIGSFYDYIHPSGGGIFISAELAISNSLIVDNAAYGEYGIGAGIYSAFDTVITNCTIAGNSAPYGSGIYNENFLTVNNSIILGAIINENFVIDEYQLIGVMSGSNNLSSYTDWDSGSNNIVYDSNIPLFINAATGDYHLISGSQAINRGDNNLAVDEDGVALEFDLDWNARISGQFVDIGAYEYVQPDVDYDAIRSKYSDFDLPESVDDINIIVVDLTAGDDLADLKDAITTADRTTLPDLIVVCTSDDENTLKYASQTDELTIIFDAEQYGALTIVSWGPENFTLNADQKSRVMTVAGSSTVVNLGGMTFTGGNSGNSASNSSFGGGILNLSATLTISDCTVSNNTSTYGGGVYSYGASTVKIIGSEFSGNSATTDGGGIYGGDKSNVTVTDCTVSGNSAIYGAGIYNGSSVTMTVINCQILDNTASTSGGGLFNTQNSTLIVTDSVISGNKGTTRGGGFTNYYGNATFINSEFANNTGNNGGGIYNGGSSYGSTLTLYGSTISGNTSSSSGGGIYNSSDGTLTVNTSTISGNTSSTNGGGIYNSSSSNLTLTNSEISGNKASNYGGGIINYGDSLVITNSTIAGNSSRIGGGIDNNNNKPLTVTNSIISSNYSTDNLNIASPNFDTEHHNLIGSYYGLFVKAPMFDSEGNLTNADTMDLHLRTYSAAINAGDNDAASELDTDVDGKARIYDDIVDIGAYEYQGDRDDKPIIYSSVVNTLNDSFDPDDDKWSLREAICYASEYVTITFAENLSGTIELTLGQLTIDNPLVIDGDGRIVIDANKDSRVLLVNAGTTENPVVLNGLIIQNGSSKNDGGGILNSGTLMVTNSAIAGNSANYGGGIYNDGDALTVVNCTIAGNSASYFGGGIYVDYDCPLTVINSIVSSNYAAEGASNISAYNLDETSHHNLINGYYGQFVNAPVFDSQGVLTNADTMDLHLRSDSIAIDVGDNDAASELVTDVDGKTRIYGDFVDIGAYEYHGDRNDEPIPYSAEVDTLNDSFDLNDGVWSLREAIYYAPEYVTITFADNLDGTILLERGQLVVDKALVIDGAGRITIDADHNSRVISVEAGTSESPVVLNGLTIQNGDSFNSFGNGGGIINSGVLTVSNSAITGNESDFMGGGIYNEGILVVANAVIEDNISGYGGGIANLDTLTITNSAFANNTAYRSGGAIENSGFLSIVNSAITDNVILNSQFGGGIANYNTVSITNCTFAGNSISDGANGIFNIDTLSVNNSIIADGIISEESDEITVSGSNNLSTFTGWSSGSDNFDYNSTKPLFVDAENGDYHLIAGSQAIDRGNNDLAVDEDGVELEFDMDGNARISGKFVDIGAYEYVQPEVDYAAIRSKYSDFDLPESVDDINIIVVDLTAGEDLDCLKNAIELAGVTTMPDLIVAITSNDANTLTYADSTDELIINIDASQYGSVTIVSWGESDLTLDADQECRVISVVGNSVVNLGGLTITNGVSEFGGGIFNNGDAVTIADCTIKNNAAQQGGGIFNIGGAVSIADCTIINNSAQYCGGIFNDGDAVTIADCTIINNSAQHCGGIYNGSEIFINNSTIEGNSSEDNGGGICNSDYAELTISNSTITHNSSEQYGGGIYNCYGSSTIIDSEISANEAHEGAGIYNESGDVSITGSKISSNIAQYAGGGASNTNGTIAISSSSISDNIGGGICNDSGTLIIEGSTISGNNAEESGAGIYIDMGMVSISNSTISNNESEFSGGGIYCWEDGMLEILNSTISGNNASQGGGIFNKGSLNIVNSLIADNFAEEYGGGLSISDGTVTVINCTIAGNSAVEGAGISNAARVELYNSIVACNFNESDEDNISSEPSSIYGYNVLSSFTNWTDGYNTFEYDSTLPLFVNPERGNYRLAKESQAIDKGNNQYAIDAGLDETSTDLAHKPRFVGDFIDIGAYEYSDSIDFVGVASTQINVYDDTNVIPDSVSQLTDWNRFYLELWAADVSEFAPGDSFETAVNYNPKYHQLDTDQTISTPDGVTAEITDQTIEGDGTVTVIITLTVSDSGFTAPGSNTYWGSVLFTPSTEEGSGVDDQFAEEPLGVSVDGVETETTLIAMPYDLERNNAVDVNDFVAFASVFGYRPASFDVQDPRYAQTSQADFDGSGVVDVNDFIAFATNFGLKKGQNYNIVLSQKVNAVPAAPAQTAPNELVIEEQTAVLTPVAAPQSDDGAAAVHESQSDYLTLAQPAQATSVQTLQQAYSSALLDLYDNQNESQTVEELSAPAVDTALYQDDEFDFLFEDSDMDSDNNSNSDVDLSVVLDELELELI